jgi:hypothetical protein
VPHPFGFKKGADLDATPPIPPHRPPADHWRNSLALS